MAVGPAILGAAVIGGAGSYLGGRSQTRAAQQAAAAQREAAAQSLAENRRQFDLSRSDQMPWLSSGRDALYAMMDLLGMPVSEYTDTQPNPAYQGVRRSSASGGNVPYGQDVPQFLSTTKTRTPVSFESLLARDQGYQFRHDALNKALERSALSKGNLFSGNFARGLAEENQGLASQEFANIWNRLAGVAGTGQASAANLGALGAGTAGRAGSYYEMGARGAGGPAAARGSMYQNLANQGTNLFSNLAFANMMGTKAVNPDTLGNWGNTRATPLDFY